MGPIQSDMTHDMLHMVGGEYSLKMLLISSNGLGFMMSGRLEGKGWLIEWINQSISYKAICRTAPATPGLLTRSHRFSLNPEGHLNRIVGSKEGWVYLLEELHWEGSAPAASAACLFQWLYLISDIISSSIEKETELCNIVFHLALNLPNIETDVIAIIFKKVW